MFSTLGRWEPTRLRPVVRWGLAAVCVILAVGLRFALQPILPPGYPYLTIFPTVLIGTYFLGTGPGIAIAVGCGIPAWYYFIPPFQTFVVDGPTILALAFYVFIVGTQIGLVHLMQRTQRALDRERTANAVLAEQRKLMFHELQHRVSNNLATVSGLLKLQRRVVTDEGAAVALDNSVRRIELAARLTRHLHDPDGQTVDMAQFLSQATRDMIAAGGAEGRVELTVDAAPLRVGPDVSIPLGLIATELVANTLEHGFPETGGGKIWISLAETASHRATLSIQDNGKGVPADFDVDKTRSLGLSIARQFARQLGGYLTIAPRPAGGTSAQLEFSY